MPPLAQGEFSACCHPWTMREIVELSWARRVPGEARACHPSSTHTCTRSVTAGEHRAQARPPFELPKHDSQPSRRTRGCGCPLLASYHYASPPKSLNVNLQVDRIPLPNALAYPRTHLSPLIASDWSLKGTSHGNGKRKGIAAIFAARGPHRPAFVSYRR